MKRYYVSVTEHLNKVVSVDAESEDEAVQKVQDAYNNSDIILDADNFSGEVIEIEPDQEYWRESEEDDSAALHTSTSQTGRVISLPITKLLRL